MKLRKGLNTVESLLLEASGVIKTRAFAAKSGQNISSSVGVTKSRAFTAKCGPNCANLLYRNNISRASPENKGTLLYQMVHHH